MVHRTVASWLLLLAAFSSVHAGPKSDAKLDPRAAFRAALKKFNAGDLHRARELFQQATETTDERLRRAAFDRLLELTLQLELYEQTVKEGRRYR
jgi:hypothetical protein